MPRKRERRAQCVALAGVVVDDVEDHLDAGRVQRLAPSALNSLHLPARRARGDSGESGAKKPSVL